MRSVLAALLSIVFLAGVAHAASVAVRNGSLTIVTAGPGDGSSGGLYAVGKNGLGRPVFRCGNRVPCWELEGVAWSPDGRSVAYGGESIGGDPKYNGLWVFDLASAKSHRIRPSTGADEWYWYNVAWSPDGRRIAYVSGDGSRGGGTGIFIVNADGSNRTKLDTRPFASVTWPSWSPDGKQIAYAAAFRAASKKGDGHSAVYVSRLDGSGRVQIADYGTAPSWSPNGKTIAYLTSCASPPFKTTRRFSGIRLVTSTGRDVAPAGPTSCSALGVAGAPAWSPDSTKIAMATRQGVFTMNADGSNLVHLTPRGTHQRSPETDSRGCDQAGSPANANRSPCKHRLCLHKRSG